MESQQSETNGSSKANTENETNITLQIEQIKEKDYNYGCRSTFAQLIVILASGMLSLSVGTMYSFPTVVIDSLAEKPNNTFSMHVTHLVMDKDQQTTYGTIFSSMQLVACLCSGFVLDSIGRKYGLILLCIPQIGGWLLSYTASSVKMLYSSSFLLGISQGFIEIPLNIYIGELAEHQFRSIIYQSATVSYIVGCSLVFCVSMFEVHWRTAALFFTMIPVILIILLLVVPETPVWLLSKNRIEDAESSLCWLRGWVTKDVISEELGDLHKFSSNSIQCDHEVNKSVYDNALLKLRMLLEPANMRPMMLILLYIFFSLNAPSSGTDRYILIIFHDLGIKRGDFLLFVSMLFSLVGIFTSTLLVKKCGKRLIGLISITLSSFASITMGGCIYMKNNMRMQISVHVFEMLYILRTIAFSLGCVQLPWNMLGEVIPMKTRNLVPGLIGAFFYFCLTFFTQIYYYLEYSVGVSGCFLLYGSIGVIGIVYLYNYLPETENKTFTQIEEIFSSKKRLKHFFQKPKSAAKGISTSVEMK